MDTDPAAGGKQPSSRQSPSNLPLWRGGAGGPALQRGLPGFPPTQTDRSGLGGRERGSLTLPGSLSSLGFTLREFNCHLTP